MSTSPALDKASIEKLAARGFADPGWFCEFFLQGWFPTPLKWVQLGVLAILTRRCRFLENYSDEVVGKIIANFTYKENPDDELSPDIPIFSRDEEGHLVMTLGDFTLVMMPRGFAKTTIANSATLWHIVYQECKYPLYLSETMGHASQQMTNVARQLTNNVRLTAIFGNLKPEQRSGLRWSESEGIMETTTGVTIAARGRGGQVRGLNVDAIRPDRIIFDDVEDLESVETDAQRAKTSDWFFADVLPALSRRPGTNTITGLGTMLHKDALLPTLMRDPEWTVIKFGAVDREGMALWPENFSVEWLERKKRSFAVAGKLHKFYLEYFNMIRSPETAKFKGPFEVAPKTLEEVPHRAIAIDPAISKKKRAAYCTITVVGMTRNGVIMILDTWGKIGATPREQVDMYFKLWQKWQMKGQRAGVESIAYQAALVHLLQEEMFRRKIYFEITPLTHGEKKEERIEGILQPRYANGFIQHQRRFVQLETQLLDWPNGGFDWADSAAMAVSLLDDFAAVAGGEGEAEKDTMPPLDEVFGGEWRSH